MKPVKYLALFGFVAATIAGALVSTQNNVASRVEAATVAEEPTGPLHLETSKVKSFSDFHFETMEGPSGDTITTYYFAAGSGEKAIYSGKTSSARKGDNAEKDSAYKGRG